VIETLPTKSAGDLDPVRDDHYKWVASSSPGSTKPSSASKCSVTIGTPTTGDFAKHGQARQSIARARQILLRGRPGSWSAVDPDNRASGIARATAQEHEGHGHDVVGVAEYPERDAAPPALLFLRIADER